MFESSIIKNSAFEIKNHFEEFNFFLNNNLESFLKDNKLNKQRLTKLGEWEYDRYRTHRNI